MYTDLEADSLIRTHNSRGWLYPGEVRVKDHRAPGAAGIVLRPAPQQLGGMDSLRDKAQVVAGERGETGGITEPVAAPDYASEVERQLAELENIYRTASIGLVFLDTDLRYVRITERLAAIYGL